jgi:hypothetical protein
MGKRRVTVLECDNPDCESEPVIEDGEPILGLHINGGVWHHSGGGGPIPKTYACSEACLLPAIVARFDAAWNGET